MSELTVAAASQIQQSKVANEVATAIAKKSLDVQRSQGQAAVALIQQVANVTEQLAGGHLDVSL
jgi:hypothetical protein